MIGDSTTITTDIVNYVPHKLTTLQTEITDDVPLFMKEDAKDFYNVIYFDSTEDGKAKITSYDIGYKNNPKYLELIDYFIAANKKSLKNLIKYLERGKVVKFE